MKKMFIFASRLDSIKYEKKMELDKNHTKIFGGLMENSTIYLSIYLSILILGIILYKI